MDRRKFLETTGAAVAALAAPAWRAMAAQAARSPDRPNIIFILGDDLGMDLLSC